MKRWIPNIIAFGFALCTSLIYFMSISNWDERLKQQQSEIYDLQNQITLKNSSNQQKQSQVIQSTTGLNTERVSHDDKIASDFLSYVMTWDSYDEYNLIRNNCMAKYNLTEDSDFIQIFFPKIVTVTSNDGTMYNRIDTFGLNVQYEDMTSYVTKINADVYTYFSFVNWSSSDDEGNEAFATCIFTYSINSDGEIFDIGANTIEL